MAQIRDCSPDVSEVIILQSGTLTTHGRQIWTRSLGSKDSKVFIYRVGAYGTGRAKYNGLRSAKVLA